MADLKFGTVEDGYVYLGGDPKDQKSWALHSDVKDYLQKEPTFLESLGRGASDVTQGLKQIGLQAKDLVTGGTSAKEYTKEKTDELGLYEQGSKGLDAGRILGNIGMTLPASRATGGAGLSSILRASGAGAGAAGANFVPEGESRLQNMAMGGILGGGLQSLPVGARAVWNKMRPGPSSTMAEAAQSAQAIGVKPTPAQESGSRTLQRLEAGLENTAGGGAAMEQANRANQTAINKEIGKRLGVNTDKLDRKSLDKALTGIEAKYDSALGGTTLKPDTQFTDDLAKIGDHFQAPGSKLPKAIQDAIDDPKFLEPMSAKDYNKARSLYGKNAVEAHRGGRVAEAEAWDALQEAVDELAKRNLPAGKASELDAAREGYRILKTVEKAADPITGNVSPQKLVNAIRQKDPRGFLYGRGDNPLLDVADAASFLKQAPDSFTASRAGMMLAPSILGGAYGGYQGGPEGAAKGAVLGTALPYALAKGYLNAPRSILGTPAAKNYLYPAVGSMAGVPHAQ